MTDAIAYPVKEAAAKVGVSETVLREAQRDGSIEFRYPTSRPVVLHDDLMAWIASAPTEAPSVRRSA